MKQNTTTRACSERGEISLFLCFFSEIELIPIKILYDLCIPNRPYNKRKKEEWDPTNSEHLGLRLNENSVFQPDLTIKERKKNEIQ